MEAAVAQDKNLVLDQPAGQNAPVSKPAAVPTTLNAKAKVFEPSPKSQPARGVHPVMSGVRYPESNPGQFKVVERMPTRFGKGPGGIHIQRHRRMAQREFS